MLGNIMQKGNCCGGFNFFNEDYVTELFRQAYPRHHVQSVQPMSITSITDYDGCGTTGIQMLYGYWTSNFGMDYQIQLYTLDSSGLVCQFYSSVVGLQNPHSSPMAACRVVVEEQDGIAWQFVGWLVQMQGPVIDAGGFVIEFNQLVGGSYPAAQNLDGNYNLTALSPVYSITGSSVTLPAGVTTFSGSVTLQRLPLGATGNYEEYTVAEIQRLFSCGGGTILVNSVNVHSDQYVIVEFTVVVSGNDSVNYYYDVSFAATSGDADITLIANQTSFFDSLLGELVAAAVYAAATNTTTQGYVRGMALVKDRDIDVEVENNDVLTPLYYSPGGGADVLIDQCPVGASVVVEGSTSALDFPNGIFETVPVIELKIGIPA